MSELTIYGMLPSPCVRNVVIFCRLSSIPFTQQLIRVGSPEIRSEEYGKINPMQTIPAIVHNGYNLWDSAAIIPYLADAFNVDNQWYPKDIKVRARINAYIHWHHQATRAPLAGYMRAKVVFPTFYGAPPLTPEAEVPFKEAVEEWFSNFKWQLKDTGYAARTLGPTIADIFAYNELISMTEIVDIPAHPEVKAWCDGIGMIDVVQEITREVAEMMKKATAPKS
jgi:glutathione S-transferase